MAPSVTTVRRNQFSRCVDSRRACSPRQSASILTISTGRTIRYPDPRSLSRGAHPVHGPDAVVDRRPGAVAGSCRLASQESDAVRQVPGKAATPLTRLVELPGRGVTRVWECAGPRDAETLMLIHGVTFTAELNWGKVFAPLSRHFRVVAIDLRGRAAPPGAYAESRPSRVPAAQRHSLRCRSAGAGDSAWPTIHHCIWTVYRMRAARQEPRVRIPYGSTRAGGEYARGLTR